MHTVPSLGFRFLQTPMSPLDKDKWTQTYIRSTHGAALDWGKHFTDAGTLQCYVRIHNFLCKRTLLFIELQKLAMPAPHKWQNQVAAYFIDLLQKISA
jgi:hypothetical protein